MSSLFVRNLYTKCKMHGTGEAQVILDDGELYSLCFLAFRDLGWKLSMPSSFSVPFADEAYYEIPLNQFNGDWGKTITPEDLLELLDAGKQRHDDFVLYIENLCALHRRRVKYGRILATQSIPTMDQVGPRTLLEYGLCEPTLLAHWVIWRKWIYDIDNRAAQETGYVFEPTSAFIQPIRGKLLGTNSCCGKNSSSIFRRYSFNSLLPPPDLNCESINFAHSGDSM